MDSYRRIDPCQNRAPMQSYLWDTTLDGEIVVLNSKGVPDFNALQNILDQRVARNVVYFLFDVPYFEGYDLRKVKLSERPAFLGTVMNGKTTDHVRLSETFDGEPHAIF